MRGDDLITEAMLDRAIEIAVASATEGGGPFGAVLVTASGAEFVGHNQVTELNDPSAHAEVQAIRAAARVEGFDLSGSTLYSSCKPCPMCAATAMWARVGTVLYAATDLQAAAAGFSDNEFWEAIRKPSAAGTRIDLPNNGAPFKAWEQNADRINY